MLGHEIRVPLNGGSPVATVANVRIAFLSFASVVLLAFVPLEEGLEFLQETYEVTIREGTNMAAVLSPDGSTLA
ncbi:uncharacterized protein METZ01_LOCUS322847, partial [marine metagenome]